MHLFLINVSCWKPWKYFSSASDIIPSWRVSEVLDVNLTNDFIEATDRIREAARLVEIKRWRVIPGTYTTYYNKTQNRKCYLIKFYVSPAQRSLSLQIREGLLNVVDFVVVNSLLIHQRHFGLWVLWVLWPPNLNMGSFLLLLVNEAKKSRTALSWLESDLSLNTI